jgi:hypothetical protein
MTWKAFVEKWVSKNDTAKIRGRVEIFRDFDYKLVTYEDYQVEAYVIITPNKNGWKNEKQKLSFQKDAKSVGLLRKKGRLLEWYRIIELHEV